MKEEDIFHQVLEQAVEYRAAFLEAACGADVALRQRISVLLSAQENPGSFLQNPICGVVDLSTLEKPILEEIGSQIGPYKLLEEIGQGGMGTVYMAEQIKPVRRCVALKIVKAGMDSRQVLARFDAERQALAVMDHPGIARFFDAGMTELGRPYFVMELVQGVPINEFCDKNRFTVRQRLELFLKVCQAVQHAHQKGIIHRDLKPTNVLVTKLDAVAVPKVIDFGIAKAFGAHLTDHTKVTGFYQFLGTPQYMSPEQAEMNQLGVDTRSDVYSLGVVLYELLTGGTPFEKHALSTSNFDELRRILRDEEPSNPSSRISTLNAQALSTVSERRGSDPRRMVNIIRGELDWIVMKALEKDRNRRYESPNGLAQDIDRYLQDKPVEACPPSTYYRANKFIHRHRGPVLSTLGILFGIAAFVFWMSFDLYRRRAMENRISISQVEYLRAAEAKSFSRRLAELRSPEYATFVTQLKHYQRLNPPATDIEKRRDSLARMSLLDEVPNSAIESELVQGIEADEIMAIAFSLTQLQPVERLALQRVLTDSFRTTPESSQTYLRRIGVLCQIDEESVSDPESLDEIASHLCDLSTMELASWRAVFQPLSEKLVERFEQIIEDNDAGQLRRMNAASLWVGFRVSEVQEIVDMGLKAPSIALDPLVAAWKSNAHESSQILRSHLVNTPADDDSADLFVRAAIGLASLGDGSALWQCFSGSLGEAARARSITQCQPRLVPFELLVEHHKNAKTDMELASLIAAIGTYPVDSVRKGINETLIESLLQEYKNNPSSAVHGACESTLVRWKVPIPEAEVSLNIPNEDLRWYRSPAGMDLVTLRIPEQTQSPDGFACPAHRIAVGSREVTVAEFRRFCDEDTFKRGLEKFIYKIEVSPRGDCPQNSVNWYVGAMFCNWLSLKEGIAEEQWCFDVENSEDAVYLLKDNAQALSGYRFPSTVEAHFFCSGMNPPFGQPRPEGKLVTADFPWGNDPKLLNEFAFTAENAMGRTWPAGRRLPNDLGLHDTLGSLLEWTVTINKTDSTANCTGGNYINALPELFHIAANSNGGFNYRNFYFGFRVARTIDAQ